MCLYNYGVKSEPAVAIAGRNTQLGLYNLSTLAPVAITNESKVKMIQVMEVRSIREVGPGRLWVLVIDGSGKSVLMKFIDTTMMKRVDLEIQNQDNSTCGSQFKITQPWT